jgi:enterochelin esterase family protein
MNKLLPRILALSMMVSAAWAQPAATPPATTPPPAGQPATPPAPGARRGGRGGNSGTQLVDGRQVSNDSFYKLGPDSMPMDGVPKGQIVGPTTISTQVFPGNYHTYWVYVPAQYDPAKATPLMVFNDGQAFMNPKGSLRAQNVLDNLIWRHELPVMLGVFIDPAHLPTEAEPPDPVTGDWGDRGTRRPVEYNPPTDVYAKVICDELLPALNKTYNISPDPDQRGIGGASSGGCAAFAVAWFRPDQFHKVFTIVGSFTDLKGEYIFPELVAAADKKPIRIFMQDGRNDNRTPGRPNNDWFLQNVRLMNALTKKGYDVNYAWGINNHGQSMGGVILPDMLRWLWRDQAVDTDPTDTAERSFRAAAPAPAAASPAATAATPAAAP